MKKNTALPVILLFVWFQGSSQTITDKFDNLTIRQFKERIEATTRYRFSFGGNLMGEKQKICFEVKNATIDEILNKLETFGFGYERSGYDITLYLNKKIASLNAIVQDEENKPMPGVSIAVNGKAVGATDSSGSYLLRNVSIGDNLSFTAIGYRNHELQLQSKNPVLVSLEVAAQALEQEVVIAYGVTSFRNSTSAITSKRSEDFGSLPLKNIAMALAGRSPGLVVTETNGFSGSKVNIQLRGNNSLITSQDRTDHKEPLFIINGVFFSPGLNLESTIGSGSAPGAQGISPLSVINPLDIERIEVLKDADATAIYGSRGAHGVIIITTKKPLSSSLQYNFLFSTGLSRITRYPAMLKTPDYLQMRTEAMANDGIVPDPYNAADILQASNDQYTDFKKQLIGNTASITRAHVSVSGGRKNTLFLLGMGLRQDNTVFPGPLNDTRFTAHLRVNQTDSGKKLELDLTALFTENKNHSILRDPTNEVSTPPNLKLYDSLGGLNWLDHPETANPAAFLKQSHVSVNRYLLLNLQATYKLSNSLKFRINSAYNLMNRTEAGLVPAETLNPNTGSTPSGSSYFGNIAIDGRTVEPQIEYKKSSTNFGISFLLGSTYHTVSTILNSISATGFANDALLPDITRANKVDTKNQSSAYRYGSAFGRITLIMNGRYLVNLSARRDGSSRFGAAKPFGNFGSVAFGWVFSQTDFIKDKLPFIGFGKIRTSWGITGSDQIGDYKYVDSWRVGTRPYSGSAGLTLTQMPDSSYSWEICRKLNIGLDLSLFKGRVSLTLDAYQNRSGNLLLSMDLPSTAGFNNLAARNSGVQIQNTGLELTLEVLPIAREQLKWRSIFYLTIGRTVIHSFPGLQQSKYAELYSVGKSPTIQRGLHALGVDSETGLYSFEDRNNNGIIDHAGDYIEFGHLDPKLHGGFENIVSWKNWQVQFLLQGMVQNGYNYLYWIYDSGMPGLSMKNQPVAVLNRWQKPGDKATLQRFSTGEDAAAQEAADNLLKSDGVYADASWLRLKNFSAGYNLPGPFLKKMRLSSLRIFINAQNMFTITPYKLTDPETKSPVALPPLKIIEIGFNCSF